MRRHFHQKSNCLTQFTLGPYLVQIWSRHTPNFWGHETLVFQGVDYTYVSRWGIGARDAEKTADNLASLNYRIIALETKTLKVVNFVTSLPGYPGMKVSRSVIHFGQVTRIYHIPGRRRPLWREGGPVSYEARPSGSFHPVC